ncbi:unnamed protein product [Diamesa hyperborea]
MGCIHSRSICEAHPNRFEVIFMDIEGTESYIPGQIEITANDLILYWKSRNEVMHQWPVGTLRRYGYDDGHFSFESGRRCETGPGIFKFKCNRSDVLFNTLQSVINGRTYNAEEAMNNMHDSLVLPNISNRNIAHLNNLNLGATGTTGHNHGSLSLSPNGTNSIQSRSNDTLNAEGNYLEPIGNRPAQIQVSRLSSNIRLSSLGSPTSPGSPSSYTNILEITSFSHPSTTQPQGNIYQESNPGASSNLIAARKPLRLSLDITPNEPAPQSAPILPKINNDVSNNIYMNSLIGSMEFADKDENDNTTPVLIQEKVVEKPAPLQLPKSPDSNNLSVEPVRTPTAAGAVYMNVALGEHQSVSTPPIIDAKENIQPNNLTPPTTANNLNNNLNNIKKDYTKHLVNGNIFGFNRLQSIDPNRCYENLEPGAPELTFIPRHRYSRPEIFSNVDLPIIERTDKSEPCTPTVAMRRVNYIVLDLGQSTNTINNNNNNNNISMTNGLLPPESPLKADYATIDFNKTVALSNSTRTPSSDLDQEGSRKTRHDSHVTPVINTTTKHSNSISE